MTTLAHAVDRTAPYPVDVHVPHPAAPRNRLTVGFRFVLALPHVLLVGLPAVAIVSWPWVRPEDAGGAFGGGGALGAVAFLGAFLAWFAILFTGRHPTGLRDLAVWYLRWRVNAMAYVALLRDEYPPFGDGPWRVSLELPPAEGPRDRLTVGLRLLLALPHVLALWALGAAWLLATAMAWLAILFTGRHPRGLWDFGEGVLRWSTRVEAYVLLLRDEYPPFAFD